MLYLLRAIRIIPRPIRHRIALMSICHVNILKDTKHITEKTIELYPVYGLETDESDHDCILYSLLKNDYVGIFEDMYYSDLNLYDFSDFHPDIFPNISECIISEDIFDTHLINYLSSGDKVKFLTDCNKYDNILDINIDSFINIVCYQYENTKNTDNLKVNNTDIKTWCKKYGIREENGKIICNYIYHTMKSRYFHLIDVPYNDICSNGSIKYLEYCYGRPNEACKTLESKTSKFSEFSEYILSITDNEIYNYPENIIWYINYLLYAETKYDFIQMMKTKLDITKYFTFKYKKKFDIESYN